jgi:hypothetical protein
LDKARFMFGFQIEIGLPKMSPSLIPPVVQLREGGSKVTYNLLCKTFKILDNTGGKYTSEWRNFSQEKDKKPWVFSFNVDLDMQKDNKENRFHDLPAETQKEITRIGQDMFSVQRLYLNLNRAGLAGTPQMGDFAKSSTAASYIEKYFINQYLADLGKDGIMLGYSVVADKPFSNEVSIIPTSMNIMVSSYKQPDGSTPTTDYSAYTLNYLLMSKNKALPAPRQFVWNWVDKDMTTQYGGVVAVNKNAFVAFLNELLSKSLNNITYTTSVSVNTHCTSVDLIYRYFQDRSAHSFNTVNDNTSHVLSFSWNKSNSSDDKTIGCAVWSNMTVTYDAQSNVYLEGTTIRVETVLTSWVHLNVCGGVTEGNFSKIKAVTTYTIGADDHGRIKVDEPKIVLTDQSDKIEPNIWSKIVSAGTITGVVDNIKKKMDELMNAFLSNDSAEIRRMLNGSSGWSFPGGRTFTFLNARFSDRQDLVANVLYVTPKEFTAIRKNGMQKFVKLMKAEPKDEWQEEPVGTSIELLPKKRKAVK